jgi:hypothetical protein
MSAHGQTHEHTLNASLVNSRLALSYFKSILLIRLKAWLARAAGITNLAHVSMKHELSVAGATEKSASCLLADVPTFQLIVPRWVDIVAEVVGQSR